MTASNMLLSSDNGVYTAVNTSFQNGELIRTTVEYTGMYLNAILLAAVYGFASLTATFLVRRKQEYK